MTNHAIYANITSVMSEKQTQEPDHYFEHDHEVFVPYDSLRLSQKDYNDLLTPPKDIKVAALEALHRGEDVELRAEHHDTAYLDERIAFMKGFKDGLLVSNCDADVKQLYRWRINEDIANMYMVQASQRGDMRNFARWNRYIYGEPNSETYGAAVDWILSDAEKFASESSDGAVRQAAQEVMTLMPPVRGDKSILIPDDETFTAVRDDHFQEGGFFDELLDAIERPDVEKITRETGEPILKHILKNNLGNMYELGRSAGTGWSVNHQQYLLKQPDNYSMTWERFIGLPAGHEGGTHIKEAVNARLGTLGLLVWGLDRFEQGAEGRALIREQVPYKTFAEFAEQPRWRFILERKIAISYGLGVGEDEPHGSAEMYALIKRIEYMYQLAKTPDDPERAQKEATKQTDGLIIRVIKGGGVYRKDEVYLDGNVGAWAAAKQRGTHAVSEGDKGKHDIANDRHVEYLHRLGILAKDNVA